jgi:hypothetical protein
MASREHEIGYIDEKGIRVSIFIVETASGHGNVEQEYEIRTVFDGHCLASETTRHREAANRIMVRMHEQFVQTTVPIEQLRRPPGPYDSNANYGRFG